LTQLPYGRHWIDDDDVAAVAQALRSDWLTTGPAVAKFEAALRERIGARHAVSCANGTAALHMAAAAAGLGPGNAAVVPSMTFLATANAVRYVGAEVVFADVDSDTGLMQPAHLQEALARAARPVKAVLPVHLNGQTADIAAIRAVADRHGLKVITDASHALGSGVEGGGTAGDCRHEHLATFSFHPVKTIAMGEGGAVTTNDAAAARYLERFRHHGMTREPGEFVQREDAFDANGAPNPWYYEMPEVGYNYRASDLHCALGASQLAKLERFIERRRALAARYDGLLSDLSPYVRPIARVPGCRPAWHLYAVLIDFQAAGLPRADLMRRLRAAGVGTQVHYFPVHRQPYYRQRYGRQALPGAERYYERALSLPLHYAMADADVERVVAALRVALGKG
jgi:UDP-4-amino-4,6-dideoxy-N-acetyl-beta-L-altrosamine transaminase